MKSIQSSELVRVVIESTVQEKAVAYPTDSCLLEHRQAVEPTIGHLEEENRVRRCHLKGALGDAVKPVLAAPGYNLRWLMRSIIAFRVQILAALQPDTLPKRVAIAPEAG